MSKVNFHAQQKLRFVSITTISWTNNLGLLLSRQKWYILHQPEDPLFNCSAFEAGMTINESVEEVVTTYHNFLVIIEKIYSPYIIKLATR